MLSPAHCRMLALGLACCVQADSGKMWSDAEVKSPYNDVRMSGATLPQYCLDTFESFGDATAMISALDGTRTSYAQLVHKVKAVTSGLHKLGVRKGDVFGALVSNCPEFLVVALAAQRLGAVVATCDSASTPEEIVAQFSDSGLDYLLTQEEQLPKLAAALPALPGVKETIVVQRRSSKLVDVDDLTENSLSAEQNLPTLDPAVDLAFILYSSGTTGMPKGVMLSHSAVVANNMMLTHAEPPDQQEIFHYAPGDVVLSSFPAFHSGGIVTSLMTLIGGATSVIIPDFDSADFLPTIERYRVTSLMVAPPAMVYLAKSTQVDQYNLTSLKSIFVGGGPVAKETLKAVKERLNIQSIIQVYGLTEASSIVTSIPSSTQGQRKLLLGSSGVPLPNVVCKVVDIESQETCGPNTDGEILVRTPTVMKGYLNNPNATKDAITWDGWLKTGDIGHYDQDGYFYIVDRQKDMIKVDGLPVAPSELEAVLLTHPDVAGAVVTHNEDLLEERPVAFVRLAPGRRCTQDQLLDHIKNHVAFYKVPKAIRFVKDFPISSSGKPLRRELRKLAEAHDR